MAISVEEDLQEQITAQAATHEPKSASLPLEIIFYLISRIVGNGLQLSNDPSYDSDVPLIRKLLKTSLLFKNETLRQIYRHPLRVYITSGETCGCVEEKLTLQHTYLSGGGWVQVGARGVWEKVPRTLLLKKLMHLPLDKFRKIVFHYAPAITSPCRASESRKVFRPYYFAHPKRFEPNGARFEFLKAVRCVIRQSRAIATVLNFHCQKHVGVDGPWVRPIHPTDIQMHSLDVPDHDHHFPQCICRPKFKLYHPQPEDPPPRTEFVFEDLRDKDWLAEEARIPVWEINMMLDLLWPWKWTSSPGGASQITPPRVFAAGFELLRHDGVEPLLQRHFPYNPESLTLQLQAQFARWWTRKLRRDWASSLLRQLRTPIRNFPWYVSEVPLKSPSGGLEQVTIYNFAVLRVQTSMDDAWSGEFLASDDPDKEYMDYWSWESLPIFFPNHPLLQDDQ